MCYPGNTAFEPRHYPRPSARLWRLRAGLDVPWTTYATAQQHIKLMLPDADAEGRAILLEYLDYINRFGSMPKAAE